MSNTLSFDLEDFNESHNPAALAGRICETYPIENRQLAIRVVTCILTSNLIENEVPIELTDLLEIDDENLPQPDKHPFEYFFEKIDRNIYQHYQKPELVYYAWEFFDDNITHFLLWLDRTTVCIPKTERIPARDKTSTDKPNTIVLDGVRFYYDYLPFDSEQEYYKAREILYSAKDDLDKNDLILLATLFLLNNDLKTGVKEFLSIKLLKNIGYSTAIANAFDSFLSGIQNPDLINKSTNGITEESVASAYVAWNELASSDWVEKRIEFKTNICRKFQLPKNELDSNHKKEENNTSEALPSIETQPAFDFNNNKAVRNTASTTTTTYPEKHPEQQVLRSIAFEYLILNSPVEWTKQFEQFAFINYGKELCAAIVDLLAKDSIPLHIRINFLKFGLFIPDVDSSFSSNRMPNDANTLTCTWKTSKLPGGLERIAEQLGVPDSYYIRIEDPFREIIIKKLPQFIEPLENKARKNPELYLQFIEAVTTQRRIPSAVAPKEERNYLRVALTHVVNYCKQSDLNWNMRDYHEIVEAMTSIGDHEVALTTLLRAYRQMEVGPAELSIKVHWDLRRFRHLHGFEPTNEVILNQLLALTIPDEFARQENINTGLQTLCSALCNYCISALALKNKKQHLEADGYRPEQCKEPNPYWRRALLNALAELKLDPEKRAHRIAHFVAQNDLDPETSKLAQKVHDSLLSRSRHYNNTAIHRSYLAALWWIRVGRAQAEKKEFEFAIVKKWRRQDLRHVRFQ